MTPPSLQTVGWREWVALPGLGIPAIKTKIDTGARTSALHAFDLEVYEEGGQKWVRFGMHPLYKRPGIEIRCTAAVIDRRRVTDSGGHREMRYVIATPVSLAGQTWEIEMTLTHRQSMRFRMLLGRTAMAGRLIVDPGGSYLTGRELARTYRKGSTRPHSPKP